MYYYFLDEYPAWYKGEKLPLEVGERILLCIEGSDIECSDEERETYHGYGSTYGYKVVGNRTNWFEYQERNSDYSYKRHFITYENNYQDMKLPCLNTDLVQEATEKEHNYPIPPYNNIFLSNMVDGKVIVTKIAENVIHYIPYKEPKPIIAKP